ncbi:MAG: amidohydrolase [Anaerolineae bacterium]|nr:amidohydrolase [Anaerolineae bacterium]
MQKNRKNQVCLPELLDKYFCDFDAASIHARPQLLNQQMGLFSGDIDDLGNYAFAGIKLYPPLGFDPWPDDAAEREKVIYLYDYCVQKQIPITCHCSDGVFMADKQAKINTAPQRWLPVFTYDKARFQNLRLNFAHFGHQSTCFHGFLWQKTILRMLAEYPNIYTDFSYRGVHPEYYRTLSELLRVYPQIKNRILFGTDFMINLLDCDSYHTYLKNFITSGALDDEQKDCFASRTPERFLFDL